MDEYNVMLADEDGTVAHFEAWIQQRYEQENRIGRGGIWLRLAKRYYEDKLLLSKYPYPEEFNASHSSNISPVVKEIDRHNNMEPLYRWGRQYGITGNHRILYTIHNYHRILLLHYFNKQYNGDIKATDIEKAEEVYIDYCENDPSLYPFLKG